MLGPFPVSMFTFLRIIFQALFSKIHRGWYTVADVDQSFQDKWPRDFCGLKQWQLDALQKLGLHLHTIKTINVGYTEWEDETILVVCKESQLHKNDRLQLDVIQHCPTVAVGIKL